MRVNSTAVVAVRNSVEARTGMTTTSAEISFLVLRGDRRCYRCCHPAYAATYYVAFDRFGRMPVYAVACASYIGSCMGCMFAPNIQVLLVFRALQGSVGECHACKEPAVNAIWFWFMALKDHSHSHSAQYQNTLCMLPKETLWVHKQTCVFDMREWPLFSLNKGPFTLDVYHH